MFSDEDRYYFHVLFSHNFVETSTETKNFFSKCLLVLFLIRSPRELFICTCIFVAFHVRSNEGRANFHDESGSYLSNLNGPARRAKDGGNMKQVINRRGFARWLLTVEPRGHVFRSLLFPDTARANRAQRSYQMAAFLFLAI